MIPAVSVILDEYTSGIWTVAYPLLFALMILYDETTYKNIRLRKIPFKIIGVPGMIFISTVLSFKDSWKNIGWDEVARNHISNIMFGNIFIIVAIVAFIYLLISKYKEMDHASLSFMLFPIFSILGYIMVSMNNDLSFITSILFNIIMLAVGIIKLRQGILLQRLLKINLGMLILSILLIVRFFDSDIGLLIRGIVFIILGALFLAVNMRLARRWDDK